MPIPATLLALAAGPQEEPSRPLRLVHPPAGAQTAFRPAAQLAERLAQLQHLQHSPNGRTISGGAGLRAAPVAAQLAQVHDEQVELEKDWPRPQQRERQLLEGHPCAHTSAEEVARVCGWEAEDDTTSGSQLEEGLVSLGLSECACSRHDPRRLCVNVWVRKNMCGCGCGCGCG